MGEIRVGTASWTDKTLLESGWYPPGANTAEERLQFYAANFPLVEVDSTYYFPPTEQNAKLWVDRTPPRFTFNVKAFSLLTQHPTKAAALPKDLRPADAKKNVYAKDLDQQVIDQMWERFVAALMPLHEAGKLGTVLFQFPQWFPIGKRNKAYVLECKRRAEPLSICVEFRNKTWMSEDNQAETLDFLTGYGLPYVCVDMPQGFVSSIPPVVAATTSDLAVMRFHGHNADEWESGSVQRRFAYLYSEEELTAWAPKLEELAAQVSSTHVLMNNCHRDYAQRNAAQLAALLDAVPPEPPLG
ncbi:MAG TPA: DUF72 domain-containing protein [Mycobacteriales bacterium]|nr:DUF72 domain-containing protein [Mycobacteriales bacterium]